MVQKAFVTKSGKANFLCPECGRSKQMDVSKFADIKKEIKLKCTCTCKHVFSVILERRQHIRKVVDLKGQLSFGDRCEPVRVIDISRLGLKIRVEKPLDLKIEDKVVLDFVLDDIHSSRVSKDMIVRTIHEDLVGLQFVSDDHYDKFGTYVLYQFG